RDEEITRVFGPGYDHQAPADAMDRRALAGESVIDVRENANGRLLTVLNPIIAQKDYRGTDCLACHQVREDAVVGAVRISYDLTKLEAEVDRNVLVSALIQLGLVVGGVVIMGSTVRRVFASRMTAMRHAMEDMARDEDVSLAVKVQAQDEIGAMGH